MRWLRSALFYAALAPLTVAYMLLALLLWPLPFHVRQPVITQWSRIALWLLRLCCGVRFRISGLDKLPKEPAVILCKHQSTWETFVLSGYFPPQAWVLKRELLWFPVFGQAIASLRPIAIDRRRGANAIRQVMVQGRERLAAGIWVVIFPEGTRVAPGTSGRYGRSGAQLAIDANCPIVPVAHDAGRCWPRNSFVKRPGTIDMVVGDPIRPDGRDAQALTAICEAWIEQTCAALLNKPDAP